MTYMQRQTAAWGYGCFVSALCILGLFGCATDAERFQAAQQATQLGKDAQAAVQRGDFDAAITHYTRALELARQAGGKDKGMATLYALRGNAKVLKGMGSLLQSLGKDPSTEEKALLESALDDYSDSIRHERRSDSYFTRGYIYLRLGQADKAVSEYSTAIELQANSGQAYSGRCAAYDKLGRKDEAIKDCEKAVQLDPEQISARSLLERLKAPKSVAKAPAQETPPVGAFAPFEEVVKGDDQDIEIVYYKAAHIDPRKGLARTVKIAVFDPQAILTRTRSGKRDVAAFHAFIAEGQKKIDAYDAKLRAMESQIKITPEGGEKQRLLSQFGAEVANYENMAKKLKSESSSREKQLLDLYMQQIRTVSARVAGVQGVELLLDNFEGTPQHKKYMPSPVRELLRRGYPDVTDAVVQEYEKTYEP